MVCNRMHCLSHNLLNEIFLITSGQTFKFLINLLPLLSIHDLHGDCFPAPVQSRQLLLQEAPICSRQFLYDPFPSSVQC